MVTSHGTARVYRRGSLWDAEVMSADPVRNAAFTASIIIPAHNEAAVIHELLHALRDPERPDEFEVIVVCNACTDATASVALDAWPGVHVLETPIASKANALRVGDAAAQTFPRLYVDADVVLDAASARELAAAVSDPRVHAAAPERNLRLDEANAMVRAYYRIWQQLPHVASGLFGRGVIAVSREGHSRISDAFVYMSDDLAISEAFDPGERVIVADARVRIHPPRTFGALLRRRMRSVAGNAQFERLSGSRESARTSASHVLDVVRRDPRRAADAAVFLAMALLARVGTRRQIQRGDWNTWLRDDTSRARPSTGQRREPVTVICVFNDHAVRVDHLDRSITAGQEDAPNTEYLPIDNVDGSFPTAAAALNHGARLARNDYLAFVHQDVYLHSLVAVERAAGMLADTPSLGVIGAVGVTSDGRLVGRIRDRVVLLGDEAPEPVDVDSIDEVLFVASRERIVAEPLLDTPRLAWHAYAVEYCARVRAVGLRAAALDIPLTHNSLTTNLARLDEAHREVAERYPALMPLRSTCGTLRVGASPHSRLADRAGSQRWRYRWLRESALLRYALGWSLGWWPKRRLPGVRLVLADIRRDIDDLAATASGSITVVNLGEWSVPPGGSSHSVQLERRGRPFVFTTATTENLLAKVVARGDQDVVLVTNLTSTAVREVLAAAGGRPTVVGFHEGIGLWALLGHGGPYPSAWDEPRARPL